MINCKQIDANRALLKRAGRPRDKTDRAVQGVRLRSIPNEGIFTLAGQARLLEESITRLVLRCLTVVRIDFLDPADRAQSMATNSIASSILRPMTLQLSTKSIIRAREPLSSIVRIPVIRNRQIYLKHEKSRSRRFFSLAHT